MSQLSEVIQTENTFYSVRSDGSAMFVLKVHDGQLSLYPSWVYMRTDASRRVHSSQWGFLKMDGKDTASFPLVSTDELKNRALAFDFVEWQGGLMTPMQSENDILLDRRIQVFFADLDKRTQKLQSEQTVIDTAVEKSLQSIQKEASQVEVTARDACTVIVKENTEVSTRNQSFMDALTEKERLLQSVVEEKTKELEATVATLQSDLAAQKPLSAEKHLQVVTNRSSWLALGLVLVVITACVVLLYAPLFSGTNSVLVEMLAGVVAILSLIFLCLFGTAILFLSRLKTA
jgi:hypothetical protein